MISAKNTIRLFWWSEPLLMQKSKENYGDYLGPYLAEKISGKSISFAHPKKFSWHDFRQPIYVTAGSILAHVNKKCIVWGSGIIKGDQIVKKAAFTAVRGPETRRVLVEQGHEVPEVYGDPALLLPKYYTASVKKKIAIGIVPHYVDYDLVKKKFEGNKNVAVIDLMTNDVEKTTDEIVACQSIISSSLHGLIIAHAYQIPAVWLRFSNRLFGDNIKFKDYFLSVDLEPYMSNVVEEDITLNDIKLLLESYPNLPLKGKIKVIQENLLKVCPFKDS